MFLVSKALRVNLYCISREIFEMNLKVRLDYSLNIVRTHSWGHAGN